MPQFVRRGWLLAVALAFVSSVLPMLPVLPVPAARAAEPRPGDEFAGGKLHVVTTRVDGADYRVEVQFFKTRHGGQCWSAVGRDKAGRIYLGNSSHRSNAFVYRLDPKTARFRYLGDLESNMAFGKPGGPENGKIHSAFVEGPDGAMYFLSHFGGGGSIRYGGHLWKLDPRTDAITDLGVQLPGNTNFTLSEIDPVRQVTYMMATQSGYLLRYALPSATRAGAFTAIQATGMNWVRHLPMDADGNVYVLGGNAIHRYDPRRGRLELLTSQPEDEKDPRCFTGPITDFCWGKDRKRLFFLSWSHGEAFAWNVGSKTVEPLGQMHPAGEKLLLYNLHVDAANRRLYSIGACNKRTEKGFYVLDLATRRSYKLFALEGILDAELEGKVRGSSAFVDFAEAGGVTGDDGTMYTGFFGGGRDQDLDPGGFTFTALVAMRVTVKEATR